MKDQEKNPFDTNAKGRSGRGYDQGDAGMQNQSQENYNQADTSAQSQSEGIYNQTDDQRTDAYQSETEDQSETPFTQPGDRQSQRAQVRRERNEQRSQSGLPQTQAQVDVARQFAQKPLTPDGAEKQARLAEEFREIALSLVELTPDSDEQKSALQSLDIAHHWARKAIERN